MCIPNNEIINNNNTNAIQQLVGEINRQGHAIVKTNDHFDDKIQELSEFQKAQLVRFSGDTELKRTLTIFVIIFSSIWSFFILVLLYFIAFGACHLSDKVTIILLTETLCLVIGLPMVVTRHFFPIKDNVLVGLKRD